MSLKAGYKDYKLTCEDNYGVDVANVGSEQSNIILQKTKAGLTSKVALQPAKSNNEKAVVKWRAPCMWPHLVWIRTSAQHLW